ncbi:MAG TPA: penicillin-binding protein 1A [Leucothrix mucor]|uniref:Penicillin-binding protein 1A n=1 Tax=Leucothrix mucor TaxID=45248 RepID=A0A7V2T254_LEUMU|nr:penicillin-binding protein 1A [Leucothrix mucor]
MLRFISTLFKRILAPLTIIFALGVVAVAGSYFYYTPQLPSIKALHNTQLQLPIRVYSRENKLIAEFGRFRRRPIEIAEVPQRMINAFIAIEDSRFYQHKGVDLKGIARVVVAAIKNRRMTQGASTITMQLARNFFLTPERTIDRKIREIYLAIKIEKNFSKSEILELYFNKIFLGKRAYGIGSAAEIYYGKTLKELTLAQTAMIAGLPKAPSKYNPINRPKRAKIRRDYILQRMFEQDFISGAEYKQAIKEKISARIHHTETQTYAPYMAEMARADVTKRYGANNIYTLGLNIYTTLDSNEQDLAIKTLRQHLLKYSRRHGYRGAEDKVNLSELSENDLNKKLKSYHTYAGIIPALVIKVEKKRALLRIRQQQKPIALTLADVKWARKYLNENRRGKKIKKINDVLKAGDIVRLKKDKKGNWQLTQIPKVTGALVSLDPKDGAIRAIAGGFDFTYSKFNRAIQAKRQPGSSFKPFIYSSALAKGFSPSSLIDDAPLDIPGSKWNPQNYGHKFSGPTRLRVALAKSKNLVSIHLLKKIGVEYAINYATRFGFKKNTLPANLTLALGTGSATPLEMATAYATLANGGYKIDNYFIRKIVDKDSRILYEAKPKIACTTCPISSLDQLDISEDQSVELATQANNSKFSKRVMKPYVNYQITSMLQDVARVGTAARAGRILKRSDIAGKTGTTNDQKDAWFCGFTPKKVTTVWMGFDQLKPLGKHETATQAALPIWIDFMKVALKGSKVARYPRPKGLKNITLDAESGLQPTEFTLKTIQESLTPDQIPTEEDRLAYMKAYEGQMFEKEDRELALALEGIESPRHRQRLILEAQQRRENAIRRQHARNQEMKRLGKEPVEPLSNIPAPPENNPQQPANNLEIDDATLRQIQKQFLNENVEIPEQLF